MPLLSGAWTLPRYRFRLIFWCFLLCCWHNVPSAQLITSTLSVKDRWILAKSRRPCNPSRCSRQTASTLADKAQQGSVPPARGSSATHRRALGLLSPPRPSNLHPASLLRGQTDGRKHLPHPHCPYGDSSKNSLGAQNAEETLAHDDRADLCLHSNHHAPSHQPSSWLEAQVYAWVGGDGMQGRVLGRAACVSSLSRETPRVSRTVNPTPRCHSITGPPRTGPTATGAVCQPRQAKQTTRTSPAYNNSPSVSNPSYLMQIS